MDAKSMGKTIASLRKKKGFTQAELADKLNISDKTVSKWENGQGYPDITILPILAALFGVSIDYLMLGEQKGIAIAGNIIADVVKNIDCYPEIGMLTNISDFSLAVGGCAANTSVNLKKIDPQIPVSIIGKIGNDENGRFVMSQLRAVGVNADKVKFTSSTTTGFCDVMSLPSGERTFFHKKGANAEFSPSDINISELNCNILHIGYILLLDKFDAYDAEYGTVMARFLKDVRELGIKTSIDVVSSTDDLYAEKIIPALKYTDYAIMNELECCKIWNIKPYKEDGILDEENIKMAMFKMKDCGVGEKIIIHSKTKSFVLNTKNNEFSSLSSLKIPKEEILGSVGAGDAFCAGCLYGIYNGFSDKQILQFASSAAACNLFAVNSVDGMKHKNEIIRLEEKYGRI